MRVVRKPALLLFLAIAARQIIVTCVFANFEKFCGVDPDTGGWHLHQQRAMGLAFRALGLVGSASPPPPTGNTDSGAIISSWIRSAL